MSVSARWSLVALCLVASGCGVDATVSDDVDGLDTSDSSLITETADRSCGVVLRELARTYKTNGMPDARSRASVSLCSAASGSGDVSACRMLV